MVAALGPDDMVAAPGSDDMAIDISWSGGEPAKDSSAAGLGSDDIAVKDNIGSGGSAVRVSYIRGLGQAPWFVIILP